MNEESVFVARFSALLQERGYTQREFAQKTNLTEGAISHYLKGDREPKGAILLNIANTLGTSVDYLRGATDAVKPQEADSEVAEAITIIARNAVNISAEDKERLMRILFGVK